MLHGFGIMMNTLEIARDLTGTTAQRVVAGSASEADLWLLLHVHGLHLVKSLTGGSAGLRGFLPVVQHGAGTKQGFG